MGRWSTRQRSPVIAERCDDTWAIHLEGSGMTHLVDYVSGEVLLFLAAAPRPAGELVPFVAGLLDDDAITMERIAEQWLLPLHEIGLVEEVP